VGWARVAGESALSVRTSGTTLTAGWDGSEQLAAKIIESAAWTYAQNQRDERWVRGEEIAQ
jgi:hypothetical protein